MPADELTVRAASDSDREAVIALARSALGWETGDRPAEFFAWKHDQNPFGHSPMWVAENEGALVGFRTLLRWRYGFEPLHYRVWLLSSSITNGFAVFRLSRRGAATEAALCELVAPDRGRARHLVRSVAGAAGADYVIAAGRHPGTVPLPGQGPILTWREVGQTTRPPLNDWDLALGDIELF